MATKTMQITLSGVPVDQVKWLDDLAGRNLRDRSKQFVALIKSIRENNDPDALVEEIRVKAYGEKRR